MKHDVFYMTTKRFIPMQLTMQLQLLNVLSNSNYQNMKKLLSVLTLMLCAICCMADNKIYYTTSNGQKININTIDGTEYFGAKYESNTYENGLGVITFKGEITFIGNNAFSASTKEYLTSIIIPNSVTTIGDYVFHDCSRLRSIIIPNSVTSIGREAFSDCTSLESITFGSSLSHLGEDVLVGPNNLKEVICYAANPPSLGNSFGISSSCWEAITLFVPAESLQKYEYDIQWECFGEKKAINVEGENQLKDFLDLMLDGELISPNIQEAYFECVSILSNCSSSEQKQKFDNECKPKLIGVWATEQKALVTAAKKEANNEYVNEVYTECINEIDAAAEKGDIIAVRRATVSGIAAVTSARILYKYLEQGIAPVTPAGAGMRMKVTTQSDKVYEFKTKDVKSVEYYNKN